MKTNHRNYLNLAFEAAKVNLAKPPKIHQLGVL